MNEITLYRSDFKRKKDWWRICDELKIGKEKRKGLFKITIDYFAIKSLESVKI